MFNSLSARRSERVCRTYTVWMHLVEWFEGKWMDSCVCWVVKLFIANAILFWSSSDCIVEDTHSHLNLKVNSSCIILRLWWAAAVQYVSDAPWLRVHRVQNPEVNQIYSGLNHASNQKNAGQTVLCFDYAEMMTDKRLKKGSWWAWDLLLTDIWQNYILLSGFL